MRLRAAIRRVGSLLDYTRKLKLRLPSPLEQNGEEKGVPAGMKTTGHSRPFAAWTVVIVTFCHSNHQDYSLLYIVFLKCKLTGVDASSCPDSVSVDNIEV